MAICNTFKKLTKKTGTFLTFGQYMDDLTEWQAKSKFHKVVPSKFVAIDNQTNYYNNENLPRFFQDFFENGCSCFKNDTGIDWTPEYAKILFWNAMFTSNIINTTKKDGVDYINGIKYVGDINIQSHNEVDGIGYSEIYCNIPNEAPAYTYNVTKKKVNNNSITKRTNELLEGLQDGELNGNERLAFIAPNVDYSYEYTLNYQYDFSWDGNNIDRSICKTDESQYNINIIVVLYDIWNDNEIEYTGIPLGIYITGLINDDGDIQNSITKYVSNEDIYNSGTSYGVKICSRYVVSAAEDNYVIKEVTCENSNNSDLSRVLTQLSISQNKMDEIINKKYNTDQNYKQLLSIFKNSRTNVPYIKQVNDSNYWYVNGKMLGPSINLEGMFEPYNINELEEIYKTRRIQALLINVNVFDSEGNVRYIYEKGKSENICIKWGVNYNGINIRPSLLEISTNNGVYENKTNTNHLNVSGLTNNTSYTFKAYYASYEHIKDIDIKFVYPTYFGELPEKCDIINSLGHGEVIDDKTTNSIITTNLQKYLTDTCVGSYEITTKDQYAPGHVCYAYPKKLDDNIELSPLSFIKDDHGFILYKQSSNESVQKDNRYIYKEMKINNIDYHVYIEKEPAVRTKQILHFEILENK